MTSISSNRPSGVGSGASTDVDATAPPDPAGDATATSSGAPAAAPAASATNVDSFEPASASAAAAPAAPTAGYRWSDSVLSSVAEAYGLDDVNALLRAAIAVDDGNRYLNRAELSAAAAQLGQGPLEGYRWSPSVLAQIMTATGLDDETALLRQAIQHDDGNRYLKRSELEAAAKVLSGAAAEIGVISDLDKTVIPPERGGQLPDTAYPGVAALFHELEFGRGGQAGDTYYVTARSPDRIADIPDWLADKGLPAGPIDTGTSTVPWVAEPEKVADIARIIEANPDQAFVLFGDTNHRDPEVYRKVVEQHPGRIKGVFLHRVRNANPDRVAGMFLFDNYALAAAELLRLGVLDESQARRVMVSAQLGGLDLTDAEIDRLLASNQPD